MSRCSEWSSALWLDTFKELMNEEIELDYKHKWTLNFNYSRTDKLTQKERQRGWRVYILHSHALFWCEPCKRTWPSARVTMLFHYRLQGKRGTVIMRPFAQSCRQCQGKKYYLPGFKQEDVEIILLRLYKKIRKFCYGEQGEETSPANNKGYSKPHEKAHCEACESGVCQEVREE